MHKNRQAAGHHVTLGLCGEVLVAGGRGYRGGLWKDNPGASPLKSESVPSSFKRHLLLAKAKPFSNAGSVSVRTYFKNGEKHCTTSAREKI